MENLVIKSNEPSWNLNLPDEQPCLIDLPKFDDNRGSFLKLFNAPSGFALHNRPLELFQVSIASNVQCGTVRGLHYQKKPSQEGKLIYALAGDFMDYIVDVRQDSLTYLKVYPFYLQGGKNQVLWCPPQFAHGYQTLTNNVQILYMHTDAYNAELDAGLNILDPLLKISLPLPVNSISTKDETWPHMETNL